MAIIFPHTGKAVNGDTKTPAGSRLDYFTRAKENRSSSASITVIGDTVNSYKSRITREIADVDTTSMQSMTVESYLDYISDVRLTTLPHRGSLWDKVLRWAEFFGLQITSYAAVTDSFATGSEEAARHILTFSRSLLMLGPANDRALEPTFSVFHHLALSLAFLLRHKSQLTLGQSIKEDVAQAYSDLLMLTFQVTATYQDRVRSLQPGSSVDLDFYATFGRLVDTFETRIKTIVDSIWTYQLGRGSLNDIRAVRKWLGPHDPAVRKLLTNDASRPSPAYHLTCEWFERPLLDFTRSEKEGVFAVTGAAGMGKSVLAQWTRQRFQRTLGKISFDTLSYTIDTNIPSETSTVSVLRSLLLQLLEISVGNKALFEALESAHKLASQDSTSQETLLWNALELGIQSHVKSSQESQRPSDAQRPQDSQQLVVVIDGLHTHADLANKVSKLAEKNCPAVKAIMFTKDSPPTPSQESWKWLELKLEHTQDDIKGVIESTLSHHDAYRSLNHQDAVQLVENLVHESKGNFLWARLLIENMARAPQEFTKVANAAFEFKGDKLSDVLQKIIDSIDYKKPEVRLIVSWLLAAQRPLSVTEIKSLMEVDLGRKTISDWQVSVRDFLIHHLGQIIIFKNDFVTIRHDSIRTALQNQTQNHKLSPLRETHLDMLKRILTYAKVVFQVTQDPSFDMLPTNELKDHFQSHVLLEYTMRYWISHFRKIPTYTSDASFTIPEDLKQLFPSSPRFAVVEWTLWDHSSLSTDILPLYDLTLRIRQKVFTDKHESVLQTLIILATVQQKLHRHEPAADYWYRAFTICQTVIPANSTITTNCCTTFLTVTQSITSTSRTEIVTRKEAILNYVIKSYMQTHGESSELVIRYYKMLATLYTEIHEEKHAVEIYGLLRTIIIKRYGENSEEEQEIHRNIPVVLKGGKTVGDVEEYGYDLFGTYIEVREEWTIERIRTILDMAFSYVKREEWFLAEETFVTLWSRVLEICRHQQRHNIEMNVMVVDVAISYTQFLQTRKRHEEACSVLIVIATAYQRTAFDSVTFMSKLKIVAEQLKTFHQFVLAEKTLKKVSSWFQATGRYDHAEYKSVQSLIVATKKEITEYESKSESSSSSSSSEDLETKIRRVVFSSTSTIVTTDSIATSRQLFSIYTKEERWSELIVSVQKFLSHMWRELAVIGGTVTLPSTFVDESIEFALLLASAHVHRYEYLEAEDIYIKVYRACKSSLTIEDQRFSKVVTILLAFYEERKYYHAIYDINRQLFLEYKRFHGSSHKLTIQTLYRLATLCSIHGYGLAEEYYREIVIVLNENSIVHVDAWEATTALLEIYYWKRNWVELEVICKSLWHTWVHHYTERKFEASFVKLLYSRYTYVLRYHLKAEWAVLRKLVTEYREVSKKAFGESSQITIHASVSLTEILMERTETIVEAMTICEEIVTISKSSSASSSILQSTLKSIKSTMATGYLSISNSSNSSTTTIERALTVTREKYESKKTQYGYAHSESLKMLKEVVLLQKRLKTTESYAAMIKTVRAHILDIVTKEKSSSRFSEAAISIATILMEAELLDFGRELVAELRRQIVIKSYMHTEKYGFRVEVTDKTCYVFIARLESELLHVDFAVVMADLLTEAFLYEHYQRSVSKGSVELTELLVRSAKLRAFWVTRKRVEEHRHLEQSSFDIFFKTWAAGSKTGKEGARIFYVILLERLGADATTKIDLGTLTLLAGNEKVSSLLASGSHQQAYEVAYCTYHFANTHKAFQAKHNISLGFSLAGLLVGRGLPKPHELPPNAPHRTELRQLSKAITAEVLATCRRHSISFPRLQLHELNYLVALLGAQQNYAELVRILSDLWENREGRASRASWPAEAFISLGRRYIEACAAAGHVEKAIHLAKDIRYNLQRVGGVLEPRTLDMSVLLSELYSKVGRYSEAMQVHEEVLRYAVNGDDYNERTVVDDIPAEGAKKHIELLQAAYVRNGGKFDKSPDMYQTLVRQVLALPVYKAELKDVLPAEKWNANDKIAADIGVFHAPDEWEFVDVKDLDVEDLDVTGLDLKGKSDGVNGVVKQVNGIHVESCDA